MPVRLGAALVAEFLGTFALCIVGILGIYHASAGGGLVAIALAHGLILSVCVCAAMPTSGGHFNPAVTLGFLVTGKIKANAAVAYIVIQLLAGVAASLVPLLLYGTDRGNAIVFQGTPAFGDAMTGAPVLVAEIIATFFLVFVIWGSAADPRVRNVGGFAIGLTVAANILAFGPISGASMNPARSFGPTLIASMNPGHSLWSQHWVYWVGPIVGAGLAAIVYHLILWPRDVARKIDPAAQDVPPSQRP